MRSVHGAHQVVATLNNDCGNVLNLVSICDELVICLEKATCTQGKLDVHVSAVKRSAYD